VTPGVLWMMLYTKYESSGLCSFGLEDVWKIAFWKPIFWPRDLLMQPTGTGWTTLIGDHPGIIPVKFGQIPISGFRGDVVYKNVDARTHARTMDDGQWAITKAHLEHVVLRWAKTRRYSTGGSLTQNASTVARTGIVRCPDGHRPIFCNIFKRSWHFSNIVRCSAVNRTVPVRSPLKYYDLNIKRKRQVPVRCVQTPVAQPMTLNTQWPYKTPYGRHRMLSSTPYDV